MRLLRAAADRGARIASICTGAFVLAAAGLLDGRRATTHWQLAELLAAGYPRVDVDPSVLTSAGVAAGLDLCLHLVRRDHGAAVAVMAPQRAGGQAQFIDHRPGLRLDDRCWCLPLLPPASAMIGWPVVTGDRMLAAVLTGPGSAYITGTGLLLDGGQAAWLHRHRP